MISALPMHKGSAPNQTRNLMNGFFAMSSRQVASSIVVLASLTACAENLGPHTSPETPTMQNDRATVIGHVVDTKGAPVAGAAVAVRASGEHTTTDSTGKFVLDIAANTTLTLAATAPSMAPTLLQQFLVSPGISATLEIPMVTSDHFKSLVAMGANPSGGVVVVALRSMSGTGSVAGATVGLTPSLGRVMYAPTSLGMSDPDPSMLAVVQGDDPYAWVLGVQPHVSIMQVALQGVSQIEPPYAIDDITWPGSFTVDAGALTLVTLFTK